jgi:hypothetical protein
MEADSLPDLDDAWRDGKNHMISVGKTLLAERRKFVPFSHQTLSWNVVKEHGEENFLYFFIVIQLIFTTRLLNIHIELNLIIGN